MPWQIATAADSYRSGTEDRFGAWPTQYGFILAVTDGVGGRPHGGPASEFALRGIVSYARWPDFPSPNALADLLRQIDLDAPPPRSMAAKRLPSCAPYQKRAYRAPQSATRPRGG